MHWVLKRNIGDLQVRHYVGDEQVKHEVEHGRHYCRAFR